MKSKNTSLINFSLIYHSIWLSTSLLFGIVFVFYQCIQEYGVTSGIIYGFVFISLGVFCFGMFIILCAAISQTVRFAPVFALPYYLILLIGKVSGETNLLTEHNPLLMLLFALILQAFGHFNWYTAKIVLKETGEDDDLLFFPVSLFY